MLRLCAILNKSLSGQKTLGRVAEWQTRWLQVPVSFGTWGFKSPFAHHDKTVDPSVGFTVFACFGLWGESREGAAKFALTLFNGCGLGNCLYGLASVLGFAVITPL